MNHTIIMLLAFAICVAVSSCEVVPVGTTAKLKALQRRHAALSRHHKHRTSPHSQAAAQGMSYVSPQWLTEYHNLEQSHGDYTIPDDTRIHVESTGKIKVPHSVVKHFNDLSQAPSKSEEPTP